MLLVALIPNLLYIFIDFYGDVFMILSFIVLCYFGGKYIEKRKIVGTTEEKKLLEVLFYDEIDD